MIMLFISGYDRKYRYTLLVGILKRVRQCDTLIAQGTRVRYRNRQQITAQKKSKLGKHANTWFLRGEYFNILKPQYTPGGRLRDKCINATSNADGGKSKLLNLRASQYCQA